MIRYFQPGLLFVDDDDNDDGDDDNGDDDGIIKLHGTKVHDELGGWQALNTRRVRPFNVYWS